MPGTPALLLIVACVLAACGGASGTQAPAAAASDPGALQPATPAPAPTVLTMPPAGDALWAIPPDRSPLWEYLGPAK